MKRRMRTISLMVFGSLILLVLLLSACGPGTTALPCSTAVITVTKPADTNDGVCSGSDCSLREAVIMSNTCAGTQTVRIPAGTYPLTIAGTGEDAAAAGDLDITDSAALLGESNPVIDAGSTDRVFEVFPPATVDMTGLIIQNGRNPDGGGIRNQGILRIHTSTIRNNTAPAPDGGAFANGGGILNDLDGTLTLEDSEVSANTADQGGGIMRTDSDGSAGQYGRARVYSRKLNRPRRMNVSAAAYRNFSRLWFQSHTIAPIAARPAAAAGRASGTSHPFSAL
jgi:CSLREA domain-containing protein